MKERMLIMALMIVMAVCLIACGMNVTTTVKTADETEGISLTYTADFYDNSGGRWFSVEGK